MNNYEPKIENNFAIVALNSQVLGGNDAVNFSQSLIALLTQDIDKVIIDLSNVEVINSSGLGMLVNGLSTARNHNKKIVLAAIPDKVMKLLQITHLSEVFDTFDTVESAKEVS